MSEPIKLLQDSFGTLFWNKVAAVWQNNALEIGRHHRHKLANKRSQSLFSPDGDDGQLDLVLCERQRLHHGRKDRAVDAERSQYAFNTSEGAQVFVYCFRRDCFMFTTASPQ
jgi:hypothetical protein